MVHGRGTHIAAPQRPEIKRFGHGLSTLSGQREANAALGLRFCPAAGARDAGDRNGDIRLGPRQCAIGHFAGDRLGHGAVGVKRRCRTPSISVLAAFE